jgi:carbonic anhydrase
MTRHEHSRRRFLRGIGIAGIGCPLCFSALTRARAATDAAQHPLHWSYEGEEGPEHWGTLSPDFKVCDLGLQQSPVDLAHSLRAELRDIPIGWASGQYTIVNNGHTIQVNCAGSGSIELGGRPFDLLQFHFHHPSEHKLEGQAFDMECHFVHKSAQHGLAVLGVLIKPGAANAAFQPVFDALPTDPGHEVPLAGVDLKAMLPAGRGYFRYMGSLTTPPCGEVVTWTIFKDPVEAAPAQIGKFAGLFPMNARPVQNLNRRFLLESNS